jgi:threonine/homoserine/homoserine lactone efflux protein
MIHYLTIGIVLGLSAGLAPGPLLSLVISETLQHGVKAGVKVALAPVATDLPIIIAAVFILSKFSDFHTLLGIVSLAGGVFVLVMGIENLRVKTIEFDVYPSSSKSFTKGILANALNPHPYLFWISVGAPTMTRAFDVAPGAPFAFIFGFYALLLGSKILLAAAVAKSGTFLNGRKYVVLVRFLGLVLCVLSLSLFRDGLKLLGIDIT